MNKKIDELKIEPTVTQDEISLWHKEWEIIAKKADENLKKVKALFGLSENNNENK